MGVDVGHHRDVKECRICFTYRVFHVRVIRFQGDGNVQEIGRDVRYVTVYQYHVVVKSCIL